MPYGEVGRGEGLARYGRAILAAGVAAVKRVIEGASHGLPDQAGRRLWTALTQAELSAYEPGARTAPRQVLPIEPIHAVGKIGTLDM